MSIAIEMAALFRRDIGRLIQEIRAFPTDKMLWETLPGATNSGGNLALHLEGNLRDFIGRQLGDVAYVRQRELEFSAREIPASELAARLEEVQDLVFRALSEVPASRWDEIYPMNALGTELTVRQFVLHLYGHLSYHLGQLDYLRRVLSGAGALPFARL